MGLAPLAVVLVLLSPMAGQPRGQQDAPGFYECTARTRSVAAPTVGLTLCDARPTAALERTTAEGIQRREGALVLEIDAQGLAAREGLMRGDLIYRVSGTPVTTAAEAAARLDQITPARDTVVNFLRGGRPYRVQLRRE